MLGWRFLVIFSRPKGGLPISIYGTGGTEPPTFRGDTQMVETIAFIGIVAFAAAMTFGPLFIEHMERKGGRR
jgi:hypothetical protein